MTYRPHQSARLNCDQRRKGADAQEAGEREQESIYFHDILPCFRLLCGRQSRTMRKNRQGSASVFPDRFRGTADRDETGLPVGRGRNASHDFVDPPSHRLDRVLRKRIRGEKAGFDDLPRRRERAGLAEAAHDEQGLVIVATGVAVEIDAVQNRRVSREKDISFFPELSRQGVEQCFAMFDAAPRQPISGDIAVADQKHALLRVDDETTHAHDHGPREKRGERDHSGRKGTGGNSFGFGHAGSVLGKKAAAGGGPPAAVWRFSV